MGSSEAEIVTRSQLDAAPADVWAWITTWTGINDELRPWLRMTAPRAVRERGLAELVIGERLCRSWVLALGVIPIDYDDITVVRLDEGRGFLERSPMLSQALWEHERTLEPSGPGCEIADRIRFRPRGPIPATVVRPVLAAIFRHRHKRLQRHFGGRPAWEARVNGWPIGSALAWSRWLRRCSCSPVRYSSASPGQLRTSARRLTGL